ncbi:hypothetical protein LTR56_011039 [Elasticomyces elasticus]|nr:hypothetical protein LTR56_011039 [Elasticomyces elasticus]KAK4914051.1 hypothetical protein LTR49_017668 [Elasticomyces elasticus]KAK5757468.1 hypothetical protein LTS12_012425 [Elasticomyces elasticus]
MECKILIDTGTTMVLRPDQQPLAMSVQAVAVSMQVAAPGSLVNYGLHPRVQNYAMADILKFFELPITDVLGFPLSMAIVPTSGPRIKNNYSDSFSRDPDPKSPTFGQPLIDPATDEALLFVRRDGRYLKMAQVVAMMFILRASQTELAGVKDREAAGEIVDREEIAARLLTPAFFATLFGRLRVWSLQNGVTMARSLVRVEQLSDFSSRQNSFVSDADY